MALPAAKRLLLLDNAATRPGQLTLANVINDASRAAGVQGDGLSNDGTTGIWPAATNLVTNGGFESNFTDWTKSAGLATGQRITSDSKFGSACGQIAEASCAATGEYIECAKITGISAGSVYTASAFIRAISKTGTNAGVLTIWWYTAADAFISGVDVHFTTGTFGWTRFINTATAPATTAKATVVIATDGATAGTAFDIHVDGVQFETGSVATPYVETDGGTAARSAGRVQMPWDAGLFTYQQGWMFACFRPGWNGAATPTNGRIATWGADATHVLEMYVPTNTGTLITASNSDNPGPITATHTLGTIESALMAWTPSAVFGGANGLALAGASRTVVNPITTSTIDIGSRSGITAARELAADFPVFVVGNGLVSNAAWAAMNSAFCGTGKPKPTIRALDQVARGAHAMAVWSGRDGTFQRRIGT